MLSSGGESCDSRLPDMFLGTILIILFRPSTRFVSRDESFPFLAYLGAWLGPFFLRHWARISEDGSLEATPRLLGYGSVEDGNDRLTGGRALWGSDRLMVSRHGDESYITLGGTTLPETPGAFRDGNKEEKRGTSEHIFALCSVVCGLLCLSALQHNIFLSSLSA